MSPVPARRVAAGNDAPVRRDGEYVLYWMIAARRLGWSFALDRALERARELGRPLLILEPLRAGYRWASDRLHRFVLDGMADNAAAVAAGAAGVQYRPYVEPQPGAGQGLLEALAARACLVVTDDFPCFFLPDMVAAAATRLGVRLERVDSNGLLPLRAAERAFTTAFSFRRFLQAELPAHLAERPQPEPLSDAGLPAFGRLPAEVERRWPPAPAALLRGGAGTGGAAELASLPIDHTVAPVAERGGADAARARLESFLADGLPRYAASAREPEAGARSGLSPWLHFGHLSVHEAFHELMEQEGWSPRRLSRPTGRREGWWGTSPDAEAWLDQLVTWRELGFNLCVQRRDYDRYESLPGWALATLEKHAADPREHRYTLDELAAAATHDPLWNAAQTELLREGRLHNSLRMLWGKKILEWTASPRQALEAMLELNNRFALDGRDPNSYSGIFWCLGRYDRPWGPERPIFGTVRYMSSQSTGRKLHLDQYLKTYGPAEPAAPGAPA